MSVYKWTLNHQAAAEDVRDIIAILGFKPVEGEDHFFVIKISAGTYWRQMKIRQRAEEVICYIHKEEESTTETYFDYLTRAGYIMGQIAAKLELLPVSDEIEADLDALDDEDEDDTDLEGEDDSDG